MALICKMCGAENVNRDYQCVCGNIVDTDFVEQEAAVQTAQPVAAKVKAVSVVSKSVSVKAKGAKRGEESKTEKIEKSRKPSGISRRVFRK